ncbi:MAG: glutamate 5-kinase [Solirubrobacterales bacterium]|nr:glutamate 5-kinase [Solirubrobacterales bacterium]MCB8915645.1 glutamate 5-kinase [Thermoleophilales bacterium]
MTLVVKLGSSIVSADDGSLRSEVLDSVCSQAAALRRGGEPLVMVTSGSIARGIRLLGLQARPRAIDELQAASAVGQGSLFREYETRLEAGEVAAAQVLLTASDVASRTSYVNARQTLRRLLDWGVVPVINENDTTATDEITFGDNDFLAAQVAIMLEARLLVLLTNTDGVYDADPATHPDATMIEEVSGPADLVSLEIGDRTSVFGTGGMRSKVAAAEMASGSGIEVRICNGTVDGNLGLAAAGEPAGTAFRALASDAPAFKQWLRHAKPVAGRILVDEGAANVLRKSGSSLLPVGVTGVEGAFEAGDAVEVVAGGSVIGKGIANYSSGETERIRGMKSTEVLELMPHAAEELIHRDYFVLA